MSESTVVSQGTFTDTDFDQISHLYGADSEGAKFRRLFDSLVAIAQTITDRQDVLSRVDVLIERLESMQADGSGYTPPSGKGFGSDNASAIAEKLLGIAPTVGAARKAFSDWGKNVNVG